VQNLKADNKQANKNLLMGVVAVIMVVDSEIRTTIIRFAFNKYMIYYCHCVIVNKRQ
jgi:hypothetical protein